MKLGHEFYPLNSLKSNQQCGVFLKKPRNSGKFTRIRILHSNDGLSPVNKGYTYASQMLESNASVIARALVHVKHIIVLDPSPMNAFLSMALLIVLGMYNPHSATHTPDVLGGVVLC